MENEMLVINNMGLVRYMARPFLGRGEDEDLIQEGYIGLIRAAQTFDAGKDCKFATYAACCITNSIIKFLRHEKRHKVWALSLDAELDGFEECRMADIIGFDQAEYDNVWKLEILHDCIKSLNDKQRSLVYSHYVLGISQSDIARRENVTPQCINRRLKRILVKMRQVSEGGSVD